MFRTGRSELLGKDVGDALFTHPSAMKPPLDIAERLIAKAEESIDSGSAKRFEEFKEQSNFVDYLQTVFAAGYTAGFSAASQEVLAMACNE